MMKTFKVKMYGREVELYCKRYKYSYPDNTMVQIMEVDGMPYCSLSTNPGFKLISDNNFYCCLNNYAPIIDEMYRLGMIKVGDKIWRSGFNEYNEFIINEEVFSQYEKESI